MSEAVRKRQSERRDAARSAMLRAGIGLLASGGYAGMKLADVSREAGYSYGLAPWYFESKAGLMMAIQEEIDSTFTEYMAAACDMSSTGRGFVEQWVSGLFRFCTDHPAYWRASVVIFVDSVVSVPEVATEHARFAARNLETLQAAFERGVLDGSIPPTTDAYSAAATIAAMVKGITFDWFGDSTVDLEERRQMVLEVVSMLASGTTAEV